MPHLSNLDIRYTSTSTTSTTTTNFFFQKVLVITGAGGQLGRAGCIHFCKTLGAHVVALDISEASLEGTYKELVEATTISSKEEEQSRSFQFTAYSCDVTDAVAVNETITAIVQKHTTSGHIDLLWNNAGYQGSIESCLTYDPSDFARVLQINVTGMFIVLQAVAKHMTAGTGSIVNTASVAGLRGTPGMIAYASSKAAVIAMTITAAKELACSRQIRVNAVSPALIGPGFMWDRQNELHAKSGFIADTPQQVAEQKITSVPLQRLGSVQEVLQSVQFLLNDETSSYTTGTNLVVDGGMSAGMK